MPMHTYILFQSQAHRHLRAQLNSPAYTYTENLDTVARYSALYSTQHCITIQGVSVPAASVSGVSCVYLYLEQQIYLKNGRPYLGQVYVPFFRNGEPGIAARDALEKRFDGLHNRHILPFQEMGTKASCRFQITGYAFYGSQFNIRRHGGQHAKTLEGIAQALAVQLQRFLQGIGLDSFFDRFLLLGVLKVSDGSLQPEIAIRLV